MNGIKDILCNICDSNNFEKIGIKNSYNIVRCTTCGLIFINPQPLPIITKNIYNKSYFSGGYDFGYQGICYLSKENEQWFKFLPGKALTKIEKITINKGTLLDIGCAVGYFLEVAKENGWDIYGVEHSEFAAKIAQDKLNIKIYCDIDSTNFNIEYFDVITMFETIEHLQNPFSMLMKINKLLKNDGLLGLSTPNLDNAKTFKNFLDWNCLTPPEHLFYFNKNTLALILKKAGFEIIDIFYGPINPLSKGGENINKLKTIYHKVKPILWPIKKILYDIPMMWYGEKSGLGEDMLVIAKKVSIN